MEWREKTRNVVERATKQALETEEGSRFSRTEVMKAVRGRLSVVPAGKKKSLAAEFEYGNLTRRQFLKLMGIGAGGAVVSATSVDRFLGLPVNNNGHLSPTGMALTDDYNIQIDQTVNAVNDLGMDPTGETAINSALEDFFTESDLRTLIEFPEGEYVLNDTVTAVSHQNFGFVSTEAADPRKVQFKQPASNSGKLRILQLSNIENAVFEGISFHLGKEFEGGIDLAIRGPDNLHIRDVTWLGKTAIDSNGGTGGINFAVTNESGTGYIEGMTKRGPSQLGDYPEGVSIIFSSWTSTGTIKMRNCHIENNNGHAFYMSRTQGGVQVENLFSKNNHWTMSRLGGDGSYLRNCTYVIDHEEADVVYSDKLTNGWDSCVAIWWETGYLGKTGGFIENVDMDCRTVDSDKVVAEMIEVDESAGAVDIRDARIRMDVDRQSIITVRTPGATSKFDLPDDTSIPDHLQNDGPDKPWDVTLENVQITGSGAPGGLIQREGAILIQDRDNSTIKNCCINLSGDRDGVILDGSSNVTIDGNNIAVPREAVRTVNGGSYNGDNTVGSADCTLPDPAPPEGGSGAGGGSPGSGSVPAACLKYFRSG